VIAQLPSAYLAWLALVWEGLEALDQQDSESEGTAQSPAFVRELLRLRQECRSFSAATRWRLSSGLVSESEHERIQRLLRDLQWLLDVAPPAPPVLAKQCVRMAQDRIFDEVQQLSGKYSTLIAQYDREFVAAV
jgi:hypothetical protein